MALPALLSAGCPHPLARPHERLLLSVPPPPHSPLPFSGRWPGLRRAAPAAPPPLPAICCWRPQQLQHQHPAAALNLGSRSCRRAARCLLRGTRPDGLPRPSAVASSPPSAAVVAAGASGASLQLRRGDFTGRPPLELVGPRPVALRTSSHSRPLGPRASSMDGWIWRTLSKRVVRRESMDVHPSFLKCTVAFKLTCCAFAYRSKC